VQECTIILRKLAISLITHYSADNVIRQTLCNVAVLLLAVSIHIYAQPFIHSDANMAELGTLFATLLVLLVGLGSEHVQKVGGSVTDAIKNQPREDQSELSGVSRVFYSISYFFMVLFVFGTIFIIFRRAMLVLLQFKTGMKIALVCRRPPTPHYFSAILSKLHHAILPQVDDDKILLDKSVHTIVRTIFGVYWCNSATAYRSWHGCRQHSGKTVIIACCARNSRH
jgi:hypothetical protein